jgi:hypothetical protein
MYFTVVFQGAPSGKTYCTVWNGYELTHCLNLLLHVYMKTKNRYYLIEMNSDCQLLKGNALFVEGNVAPLFQWTCLFEKPALVMFFLEEKNVFVDHPLKVYSVFTDFFGLGKRSKVETFLGRNPSHLQYLIWGKFKMDAFPEEGVQDEFFPQSI